MIFSHEIDGNIMTDVHSAEQRSYNMSMIKGKDTNPEIILRKALYRKGIRGYRIHKDMLGKPDIIFTNRKLVIFVDGCFWHKCPICFKSPESNKDFWTAKINRNVERDKEVSDEYIRLGWKLLRIWEHEIEHDIEKCVERISDELK